jgi:hypothetical protein
MPMLIATCMTWPEQHGDEWNVLVSVGQRLFTQMDLRIFLCCEYSKSKHGFNRSAMTLI